MGWWIFILIVLVSYGIWRPFIDVTDNEIIIWYNNIHGGRSYKIIWSK